jgi:hypothetical protein
VDKIEGILDADPALNKEYRKKLNEDNSFRSSEWEQLYFIYKRSPYFEKSLNVLPVYYLD